MVTSQFNYTDIKSKLVFQILKEFQTNTDMRSLGPLDSNKIFSSLVQKRIFSEDETPRFYRIVTSLANPYDLMKHHNGTQYSLTDKGNLMIESWAEYYQDEAEPIDYEKIKLLQEEIKKLTESHPDNYYQFTIFISHVNADYQDLHQLLIMMIAEKIKPIYWFQTVDEDVCKKLCVKIDDSELFLIYLTERVTLSQMTNNEIGFIEGKRFYKNEQNIVLRIYKTGLNIGSLKGFYTRGIDMIDFNPENVNDIQKVIKEIKRKHESYRPNPQSVNLSYQDAIRDSIKMQLDIESMLACKIILSKDFRASDVASFVYWAMDKHNEVKDPIRKEDVHASPTNPFYPKEKYYKNENGKIIGEILFWVQHQAQLISPNPRLKLDVEFVSN